MTVKKRIVKGKETDFGSKTQNTSYIERFNLTLRQKVSYLQRKTLGYCKNQKNFQQVLWINLFDYNYRQFHKSLRQDLTGKTQKFKRRYQYLTPAMKMGLTSTQLEWQDLILGSHIFLTLGSFPAISKACEGLELYLARLSSNCPNSISALIAWAILRALAQPSSVLVDMLMSFLLSLG